MILNYSLYQLLFYFIIYSFLGWVVESSFKSLLFQKVINSGFLRGPFIPIYAVGAVTILIFFEPYKDKPFLLFILGVFFMTLLEYVIGWLMEKIFNTRWWDYTGNFMNIGGKICLENSIYWGLLSVVLVKYLHPFFGVLISKIPVNIGEKVLILFIIYFIIDYTCTLIEVLNIQESVKILLTLKENSLISVTTGKIGELKNNIINKSKRLIKTYPRLTYLGINKKLKDIVSEIKKNDIIKKDK